MPLKLMYITNDEKVARIADANGVDWIFIDLELIGKESRQGHLDTVISHHCSDDIKKIRSVLSAAKLLVRINPIHDGSKKEIETVLKNGTDILMLPYFKSRKEVKTFIDLVEGRAKTCLLFETPEAVDNADDILALAGIDYAHIGLNDLHLGYRKKFMFELLIDGTVEKLCEKFRQRRIPYGFGGIARLGYGILPAEMVIAEHYRLGSSMAILSRSFCNTGNIGDISEIENIFKTEVRKIRRYEDELATKDAVFFAENLRMINERIKAITGDAQ